MKKHLSNILQMGKVVTTRHALDILSPADITEALRRHESCDWGEVCEEDWARNNDAVMKGLRILSAYRNDSGNVFWIITEADRSYTTVLMPSDY